jgi:hypothetical protein
MLLLDGIALIAKTDCTFYFLLEGDMSHNFSIHLSARAPNLDVRCSLALASFFFLNGKGVSKDPKLLHSRPVGYNFTKRPPKEIKLHTSPVKLQEGP